MITQRKAWLRLTLIWAGITVLMIVLGSIGWGFYLLAGITAIAAIVSGIRTLWEVLTASPQEQAALHEAEALPFKHFYKGTGISVDPARQLLHLYSKPHYKVYPFAAVRGWERNAASGGEIIATAPAAALGAALSNLQTAKENERQSGFFVNVKDTEHPRWRIAFPTHPPQKRDRELARWMEIMEQHINDRG